MKALTIFLVLIFGVGQVFGLVQLEQVDNSLNLTTIYGTIIIDEPVLIDLIHSNAFQRLKNIRQYGVLCHAHQEPEYTRYQHSLGVFFLARRYGASTEEQIAALLHDVSHTVFSHVGDVFYNSNYRTGKQSYQDEIHEQYLEESGIAAILQKYNFGNACSEIKKQCQRCFDQPLPGLCADRIEYNLTGGYIDGMITQNELNIILEHLHFKSGEWFFDDVQCSKKFGLISLKLSELRWGSTWSAFIDYSAAQAMKRACALGIITKNDIQFSTDDVIWEKLIQSADEDIKRWLDCVQHPHEHYCVCDGKENDLFVCGKFSGTDPLIITEKGLTRLSEIDKEYKKEYERVKNLVMNGACITLN